jgi:hypothetical protein
MTNLLEHFNLSKPLNSSSSIKRGSRSGSLGNHYFLAKQLPQGRQFMFNHLRWRWNGFFYWLWEKARCLQLYQSFSTGPHSKFRITLLHRHFNNRHSMKLGIQYTLCIPTLKMPPWIWFSAASALWIRRYRFLSRHNVDFTSFMLYLIWEFKFFK